MSMILLVDDSSTERAHSEQALKSIGAEILTAKDGEEALAKAQRFKPTVIVMDVVMPKLNGFQTCRRLKRDPITRDIPVILLTSKGEQSDRAWGEKQGAAEYLVKPVEADDLLAAVKKFVE